MQNADYYSTSSTVWIQNSDKKNSKILRFCIKRYLAPLHQATTVSPVTHRPDRGGRHGRGSAVVFGVPSASVSLRTADLTGVRASYAVRASYSTILRAGLCPMQCRSRAGSGCVGAGAHESERASAQCTSRRGAAHLSIGCFGSDGSSRLT